MCVPAYKFKHVLYESNSSNKLSCLNLNTGLRKNYSSSFLNFFIRKLINFTFTFRITFEPSLKTFEMDIAEKMGIKEDRAPKRTFWYPVAHQDYDFKN